MSPRNVNSSLATFVFIFDISFGVISDRPHSMWYVIFGLFGILVIYFADDLTSNTRERNEGLLDHGKRNFQGIDYMNSSGLNIHVGPTSYKFLGWVILILTIPLASLISHYSGLV